MVCTLIYHGIDAIKFSKLKWKHEPLGEWIHRQVNSGDAPPRLRGSKKKKPRQNMVKVEPAKIVLEFSINFGCGTLSSYRDLSSNNITTLPSGVFRTLSALYYL